LRREGKVKRKKVTATAAASSSSSSMHDKRHARGKLPILGGGLVQEIGVIFYNTKAVKEDFPAPFCQLPDRRFVAWVTRNLGLLGVGESWAEWEAWEVVNRTRKKKEGEAGGVKGAEEEEEEDIYEIVKEMGAKLAAMEKTQKRERMRNALWMMFRSLERII
jgi:hypothetical protein